MKAEEEARDEIAALRKMLAERESQLMAASHRLADTLGSDENRRRDSFFDRLPFKSYVPN